MATITRRVGTLMHCGLAGILITAVIIAISVLPAAGQTQRKADLSRLVIVGDSISAGHQNSSLMASQQVNGYASLIANQAGVELPLPLISHPGFPAFLQLVSLEPLPVIEPYSTDPAEFGQRINPEVQAHNLSIPGARAGDALRTLPDVDFFASFPIGYYPYPELSMLVLAMPGPFNSQVDWAEALEPTTVILWLGSNDVLWAMINGDASFITPLEEFRSAYEEVISRLAATGATMVVGNIPDVTVIPFLTSAEDVAAILGIPIELLPVVLGISPGDYLTPLAFPLIAEGIFELPPHVVVTAGEIAKIQAATAQFNNIIAEQAALHGAPLVDIRSVLNMVDTYGLVVGGQRLTTGFLGGVFTLDGIHPTNTAHAVVANEFIKALNTNFAANIPKLSVVRIMKDDPLVFPGVGQPAAAFGALSEQAMQSIMGGLIR